MTTRTAPGRLSDAAVRPLRTLDPTAPPDDLEWLDQAIGDARVVAIGESAHYNRESLQLRHRLLRYLVERHGFSAYALESGFVEGWQVDDWLRGGDGELGPVTAAGTTSLMASWTQVRDQFAWMREHNRTAARPVGFYGVDLPASMVSPLPGLDAVTAYLAEADPGFRVDPRLRETAASFATASPFSAPATIAAFAGLEPAAKDASTAELARVAARMAGARLDLIARTGVDAYERALRSLHLTVALDALARALTSGDHHGGTLVRDAAMADTVEWVLGREDRIVVAAHNGHVLRRPGTLPGMPPATTMGMHLADRLGADYLVTATTTGAGQTLNTEPDFYAGTLFTELDAPRPGSLDALMAATHDGPFATDLRRLSPTDDEAVRAAAEWRFGAHYSDISAPDACDVVIHLPHVTAADPDPAVLACVAPEEQEAFARWMQR
jgi:erythromycin esterase